MGLHISMKNMLILLAIGFFLLKKAQEPSQPNHFFNNLQRQLKTLRADHYSFSGEALRD